MATPHTPSSEETVQQQAAERRQVIDNDPRVTARLDAIVKRIKEQPYPRDYWEVMDRKLTVIEAFVRIRPSSNIRSNQLLHRFIDELGMVHPSNRTAALKVAWKVVKAFGDVPCPMDECSGDE